MYFRLQYFFSLLIFSFLSQEPITASGGGGGGGGVVGGGVGGGEGSESQHIEDTYAGKINFLVIFQRLFPSIRNIFFIMLCINRLFYIFQNSHIFY